MHAWSPAVRFASSEGGKWADLLPSEGGGRKELLDRSSLPLCRRVREGALPLPDRSPKLADSSNPLPVSNDGERGEPSPVKFTPDDFGENRARAHRRLTGRTREFQTPDPVRGIPGSDPRPPAIRTGAFPRPDHRAEPASNAPSGAVCRTSPTFR